MVALAVTVDDREVNAMLTRLQQRMSNLTPVMRQIGDTLKNDALNNFKGQHAPDGTPWKTHSANTQLSLIRRLIGHRNGKGQRSYAYSKQGGVLNSKGLAWAASRQILRDTGILRASVNVLDTTPTSVTVGSRLKYAAIHQFGGKAGRGRKVRIPARPFIGMSAGANRTIIDTINAYMGTNQ
jgi:phage gpG-like protein